MKMKRLQTFMSALAILAAVSCNRMQQAGEGQDLSGIYAEFENISSIETETYTITNKPLLLAL